MPKQTLHIAHMHSKDAAVCGYRVFQPGDGTAKLLRTGSEVEQKLSTAHVGVPRKPFIR